MWSEFGRIQHSTSLLLFFFLALGTVSCSVPIHRLVVEQGSSSTDVFKGPLGHVSDRCWWILSECVIVTVIASSHSPRMFAHPTQVELW